MKQSQEFNSEQFQQLMKHVTGEQTVSVDYIEKLEALKDASIQLKEVFLPKVDYGKSFLSSEAIQALNEFNIKVESFK